MNNKYIKNILKKNWNVILKLSFLGILSSICILISPILLNIYFNNNTEFNYTIFFLIIICMLCSYIFQLCIIYIKNRFALSFKVNQAKILYKDVFNLKYDKYLQLQPSYLVERINMSIMTLYNFFSDGLSTIISNIVIIVFSLFFCFSINIYIGLLLMALIPINILGYKSLNKKLQEKSSIMQNTVANNFKDILNVVNQVDYIKQINSIENIINVISPNLINLEKSIYDVNLYAGMISNSLKFINSFVQNFIIMLCGYLIFKNDLNFSSIFILSVLLPIYFNSISNIISTNVNLRDLKGVTQFINESLIANKEENGEIKLKDINSIQFDIDMVALDNKELISDVHLLAQKGDIIGIIGDSGCGKSTLMKYILKFRDTKKILINNIDIKNIENTSLRNQICYFSQNIPILSNTIRENLVFGKSMKNINLDEVIPHNLLDKIICSPNDYEKLILENGNNLSGGEKQKIAIARQLIDDGSVYILDEITSSIDKKSEKEIMDFITSYSKDKIIFIISHNENNLVYCNKKFKIVNREFIEV